MRAAVVVSCLALAAAFAEAQGTLVGTVRAADGTALYGALVSVPRANARIGTSSDGHFSIALPIGRHEVIVTAVGFTARRDSVEIRSGGTTRLDVRLSPTAQSLGRVVVSADRAPGSTLPAPERLDGIVTTGARSEVVTLRGTDVNLAEKVGRQVFARVPGVLVYDMDGAGNQTNISTRGLDPHRSWEFNVRQDGILVNSDIYGYPASHYSPPLEAMEQVALVRGTAALQYGAQFGGLLNYRTRGADSTRRFSTEGSLTAGSFGLAAGFVSAGGRVGAFDYNGYAAYRRSDGFREAANSEYDAEFVGVTWHASPTLRVRAQMARSYYLHRVPGPLTDAMFRDDPQQATRRRNWFSPEIFIPALLVHWSPSPRTELTATASRLTGRRGSTLFVGFATQPDTANSGTGLFAPRAVDIDDFDSRTYELRVAHEHRVASRDATLATGITIADNTLHRRQQGPGSRGDKYDLTVTGAFGRDLEYRSTGISWYAEETISLTSRWRIVPGLRIERGVTDMTGTLAYYDPADTPRRIRHDYPLFGLRSEFARSQTQSFYGGWSEAFRPMLLKDLLPENAIERTDPAMRDARGWTAEAGVRGRTVRATYDVGGFVMRYDNRFGGVLRDDGSGPYLFKTNVGSARTIGIEATAEYLLAFTERGAWRTWGSLALFDARYRAGTAVQDSANVSLDGKRVEGVPSAIVRAGLTVERTRGSVTLQVSHTSASFADPLNVRVPPPTGARGIVPAYTVVDLSATRRLSPRWQSRMAVSNVLDASYFTKRPAFYPGPGVWPSDGRAIQVGLSWSR